MTNKARPETNSLAWHEMALDNSQRNTSRLAAEIKRLQNQYDRCLKEDAFRLYQIQEARKEGKSHFDAERFRKSKRGDFGVS